MRFGLHNVNGLAAKLPELSSQWQQLGLDIVAAVDTHISFSERTAVQHRLHTRGWRSFWCIGLPGQARTRAGVAIIVRSSLLDSGALQVRGQESAPVQGPAQGRLLQVPLEWAGQQLNVVAVYMHASDHAANAAIISGPLREIYQHHQQHPTTGLMVLGDFNFVPDTTLDRRHRVDAAQQQQQRQQQNPQPQQQQQQQQHPLSRDTIPAAAWTQHLPGLCDAWRDRHPARMAFTYVRADAASRIDRIYCSATLKPQLVACRHEDKCAALSDHSLVMAQLQPRGPGVMGPGLRRLRLSFQAAAACRSAMQRWLVSQQPPADATAVVTQWWPAFKQQLAAKIVELNRQAKQLQTAQPPAAQHAAAVTAVLAAHVQLETCSTAALPATLASVVHARTQLAELQQQQEELQRQRRRQQWVHQGERPGPAMTRILKPPKGATFISGLHAPGSGHLVRDGVSLARIIGSRYAALTVAPQVQQTARQAVLQAVTQHSQRLDAAAAVRLGDTAVTVEEVITAISHTAPGKAPGLDGIPGEFFRQYRVQFAPLLAALYSAIGATQRVPDGFLDGVILPILKPGGDAADPAAFRPIQLLNYDYRVLAKILADRLLAVAGEVVHPVQSAFLQRRHIGDSIRLLQFLPALLHEEQRMAVVVFTDFAKAYDTVDRSLLYEVAAALGIGDGFVSWMRVLLSDTYTCATVNGFCSPFYRCDAGVRQGCPLAPLLYLFVGQALLCFLKQRGIGIVAASQQLAAAQYADDAEVFLLSLADVPTFMSCMTDFAKASGQCLNPTKTRLLHIGQQQAQAAAPGGAALAVGTMQIVAKAKSLGVFFDQCGKSSVDWDGRLTSVRHRMQNISRISKLSAFGRAFAANAYALSTLLYAAQFAGHVPADVAAKLTKWAAALVDAGLGPDDDLRRAPDVPVDCLSAHPKCGGFGLLPIQHHLLSRWACEALPFLQGGTAPWVAVARELWPRWAAATEPFTRAASTSPWGLMLCRRHILFPSAPADSCLPSALRALALGLRALPPLRHVGANALDVDDLCWHAPLWANPIFTVPQDWQWFDQQRRVVVGLESVAACGLLQLPKLQSLGQAVLLSSELARVCALPGLLAQRTAYERDIWGPWLNSRAQYADRQLAVQHVQALLQLVPQLWVAAARVHLISARAAGMSIAQLSSITPDDLLLARESLCADLGWQRPGGDANAVIRLADLTVALATKLQRLRALDAIAPRHAAYLDSVRTLDSLPAGTQLPAVRLVLSRWWGVRVANTYKEAAWRLALNAFPTAQRMQLATGCAACSVVGPGVEHHFWTCPVAVAVRTEVESQLHAFNLLAAGASLPCSALWLACAPHRDMHRLVWDMVCLAVIHAFEHGRKVAWAVSHQLTIPVLVEQVAVRAAVGCFWDALADFAATARVPRRHRIQLLTCQPFIAWHTVLCGNGLRVVRR